MSNDIDNVIIEHLKALRNQLSDLRGEMHDEFQEIKHRLTTLETLTR